MRGAGIRAGAATLAVIAGLAGVPGSAVANGYDTVLAACQAEANATVFTGGAKSGYAVQYQAVVDACLDRGRTYIDPHANRRKRVYPTGGPGFCPPGAPVMYRGTIYCPVD
ncbi:hypothetical protein [Antarctobacter jejuensis]|uniref:hypothetical protein n=1 Tax=Antarctobacter jejuensis TaxID=1439938 RepID=UPI003FCEF9AD